MNYGLLVLALVFVIGATASIFVIAQGSTAGSQAAYNDTWSQSPTLQTNVTKGMIDNTTARIAPAGGGLAFLFAGTLIFVGIVYTAGALSKHGRYSSRR